MNNFWTNFTFSVRDIYLQCLQGMKEKGNIKLTWWLSEKTGAIFMWTGWMTAAWNGCFSAFCPSSFKSSWHRFRVDWFSPRDHRLCVRQRVADVDNTAGFLIGKVQTGNCCLRRCLRVLRRHNIVWQTQFTFYNNNSSNTTKLIT